MERKDTLGRLLRAFLILAIIFVPYYITVFSRAVHLPSLVQPMDPDGTFCLLMWLSGVVSLIGLAAILLIIVAIIRLFMWIITGE
jgi:hypothetical protein